MANSATKQIVEDYHTDVNSIIVLDADDIKTIEIVYTDGQTTEPWDRFKEKIK